MTVPSSEPPDDTRTISSQSSQSTNERDVSIWVDEIEDQQQKRKSLNEAVNSIPSGRYSPLLSTLNASWDDISNTQQRYYLRKASEAITTALSVICPGQENEIWNSLRQDSLLVENQSLEDSSKRKYFYQNSAILEVLVKAHDAAESWQTKRQILSLFANDFSRVELQQMIPGLSKWRIDEARQHVIHRGKGLPVLEQPIFRRRIDAAKVDHFLDFISRPDLLQDVAFGTKNLKLDSGEHIIIPAVIRTLIPSRVIEQYAAYCKEEGFEPAGERSLFRILDVCSASMQKSLQGLDNVTAAGAQAFQNLEGVVHTLEESGSRREWGEAKIKALKEAKRYLKTDYKVHVSRQEDCRDHCTVHALSDPSESSTDFQGECYHNHACHCERCEALESVTTEILQELEDSDVSEEKKSRVLFDYKESLHNISAWKAHLLRSVNQEEAKQDTLDNLNQESCLIVMDWATKFLPHHYREQMSEFFGKRGRSWHVSAVITKSSTADKFQVECFVHLFNSCTQNSFAVASIIEHLLKTLKKEYHVLNQAFLRSDNAGCYKNGALLLNLPEISVRSGIKVVRYDFSDPQAGKDICDRKTAPIKAHIKRWVNEKHDVLTAEDMKLAIESHGGLKGCRAAVVEVDVSQDMVKDNKIPGISLLNNFQFTDESGIREWRAYDIGPGRLLKYCDLQVTPQSDTNMRVIEPFGELTKEKGIVGESSKTSADIYSCQERGCVLTFRSQQEADAHMDTGKHKNELESESLYDTIRKKWATRVTGVTVAGKRQQAAVSDIDQESQRPSSTREDGKVQRWALKSVKKPSRMTDKSKAYLVDIFEQGSRIGHKADPVQISKQMQLEKDGVGKLLFQPDEWRTPQQISQLFSRLAAAQKQVDEEDIDAEESEVSLASLRNEVMQQVASSQHPVVVGARSICHLVHDKKLGSLKIVDLQSICDHLNIEPSGSLRRKKSFTTCIENYLMTCQCFCD